MGLLRKSISVTTMGVVPFRTKDERVMRYARQTRNAARDQAAHGAAMLDAQRQQIAALVAANAPANHRTLAIPPGWYPDPIDQRFVRWFDGGAWSTHVTPRR